MTQSAASETSDLRRVQRLNELWRIAGPEPLDGSLGRRLLFRVRQALAHLLRPQETFNAAVVEYINTAGSLQAVIDETMRYRDALGARERRIEAAMQQILSAQEELRASLGVLQQAVQNLKHEVGRVAAGRAAGASGYTQLPAAQSVADALDSHKYVGFEDHFRGSPEDIRRRLADYIPVFFGASDVLDLGCGRGEFLDLLREHRVTARGIDVNHAMVQVCRERGLDATEADALTYLRAQPDGSLGGLIAAQVVEHLEPAYLTRLLDAAFDKLRPGAPIVLETINPACWFAFFESYIRDFTHVRPLHPDTLKYLMIATGFQQVEVRYRAPYPEHDKLQPLEAHPRLGEAVDTLNSNVDKLNRLLFTWLDYAAIGRRP